MMNGYRPPTAQKREPSKFQNTNFGNELVDDIQGIVPLLLIGQGKIGQTWPLNIQWGINVGASSGGPDFTDERYWIQTARIVNTSNDAWSVPVSLALTQVGDPDYAVVPVTNLQEQPTHTHTLPLNAPVGFFAVSDLDGNSRFVMIVGGGAQLPTGQYPEDVSKVVSVNQIGFGPVLARSM